MNPVVAGQSEDNQCEDGTEPVTSQTASPVAVKFVNGIRAGLNVPQCLHYKFDRMGPLLFEVRRSGGEEGGV
jgi:hypothetical protein